MSGLGWERKNNKQKDRKKKEKKIPQATYLQRTDYGKTVFSIKLLLQGETKQTLCLQLQGDTSKSKGACGAFSDFPDCAQWEASSEEKRLEIFILKISESSC